MNAKEENFISKFIFHYEKVESRERERENFLEIDINREKNVNHDRLISRLVIIYQS